MGMLQEMIARFKQKSEKQKAYEEDLSIQRRVEEKSKSANERELESYMKENRENKIKLQVERIRRQKMNNIYKATLMKNNPRCYIDNSLMKDKKNFLRSGF
jgi:hypothetical protein